MDLSWFNQRVKRLERGNWLYNLICFFMFSPKKKLSYKQIYMLIYELNRKKLGEKEAKDAALIRVLEIYKYLHDGQLPEMVDSEDGE